jgi:hypothetical protein
MKIFIIIFLTAIVTPCFSQEIEKTISVIVDGEGRTQKEAQKNAFGNALVQILTSLGNLTKGEQNNRLIDETNSIKSYKIVRETELENGKWLCTLNAIISISNLSKIVESKGGEVSIRGGLYALIIKQQSINAQNEEKIIQQLLKDLHVKFQSCFNYSIASETPMPIGDSPLNNNAENLFKIPLIITVSANSNIELSAQNFNYIVNAVSLSNSEIEQFQEFSIPYYTLSYKINSIPFIAYFRSKTSMNDLMAWALNWSTYTKHFNVFIKGQSTPINVNYSTKESSSKNEAKWVLNDENGMVFEKRKAKSSSSGNNDQNLSQYNRFEKHEFLHYGNNKALIEFPLTNQKVMQYFVENQYTLMQLQNIEGFRIAPNNEKLEPYNHSNQNQNSVVFAQEWTFDSSPLKGIDNGAETGEITFFIRINEKGYVTEIRLESSSVKLSLAERYKKLIKNARFSPKIEGIRRGASGYKTIKIVPTN